MKINGNSSENVLQELTAWCQLAHDVVRSSQQPLEKPAVRTLKQTLVRHHARHLAQLREWLGQHKATTRIARHRTDVWLDVVKAMRARDEYVAIAACALLERAVLAVYDRAADHLWLENSALRLVRRQRLVLKCCHRRHLRRPVGNRERAGNKSQERPVFGGVFAVA